MTSHGYFVVLFLVGITALAAAEDDIAAYFKTVNAQARALQDEGKPTEALPFAAEAMQLGETLFGPDSENLAKLTLNYGRLLLEAEQQAEAARLLRRAVKRYAKVYGNDALELIDPLMQLGHATVKPGRRQLRQHYQKAIEIAKASGDEVLAAELSYDAGVRLLGHGNSMEGVDFLEESVAVFGRTLGPTHQKTALGHLWLARFHFGNRDYPLAVDHSVRATPGFSRAPDLAAAADQLLSNACSRLRRDPAADVPAACP